MWCSGKKPGFRIRATLFNPSSDPYELKLHGCEQVTWLLFVASLVYNLGVIFISYEYLQN